MLTRDFKKENQKSFEVCCTSAYPYLNGDLINTTIVHPISGSNPDQIIVTHADIWKLHYMQLRQVGWESKFRDMIREYNNGVYLQAAYSSKEC